MSVTPLTRKAVRATGALSAALFACAALAAPDDQLVLSSDGSTLTGDHGGGGGSATWLRKFDSGSLIGLGAEYQTIFNSHWTLGTFNGAIALGEGTVKTSLYTEAHVGAGDAAREAFHYTNVAGGLLSTLTPWLSAQLEERYIDIGPSHGNLPKVGVSLRLAQSVLASLSYAESFGGNLGTKLGTARLDYSSARFSWLVGAAYGPVAPSVLNIIGQTVAPARTLKEGFVGAGTSFGRTDWKLIGDYQDLEGFKRTTITLNCTVHLGALHSPP
jgi:hypothetical protein